MPVITPVEQTLALPYKAPVVSATMRAVGAPARAMGIYDGLYAAPVTGLTVKVFPGTFEIRDKGALGGQISGEITAEQSITIDAADKYILLRWERPNPEVEGDDRVQIVSAATKLSTDLVIGEPVVVGGAVTLVTHGGRTDALASKVRFVVEPTSPASMYLWCKGGWAAGLTAAPLGKIEAGRSPIFTAPTISARVDVLYLSVAGTFLIKQGVEGAAVDLEAVALGEGVPVATVTLSPGDTSIAMSQVEVCVPSASILPPLGATPDMSNITTLACAADGVEKVAPDIVEKYWVAADGNSWYRLYKSGWLEQGGIIITASTDPVLQTITFPHVFTNTKYTFLTTPIYNSYSYTYYLNENTGSRTVASTGITATMSRNWYACGF